MEEKIPRLLEFLFGEGAERAQRGASSRLLRWGEAFEGWLGERKPGAHKQAVMTWRRLLQERGKMPWELREEDIEAHLRWMEAQGLAATTRANAVGIVGSFYRWCDERDVDAEWTTDYRTTDVRTKGFNPAAGVRRPRVKRYAGATVLSRGEVEALLGILRRDVTPLGKRDCAFFLMRLRMGAPLKSLLGLRRGQIEAEEGQAWVRWREGGERVEMPGEVWEAIQEWLRASGREGNSDGWNRRIGSTKVTKKAVDTKKREERFVFAPVVNLMQEGATDRAEAWVEGRAVSSSAMLGSLKLYGRRAGIEEGKLTMMALRRTATRMRLEEGESVEGMQRFLDSREEARFTKSRLGRLPELPAEEVEGVDGEAAPPARKPRPFQAGEGMTHGLYAHSQPAEEVLAMMREDVQGIEEEIVGMRLLGRGLMEMQGRARSSKEAVQLMDAYTLTARRLAGMIEAEKQLAKGEEEKEQDEGVERMVAIYDNYRESQGESQGERSGREELIAEALGDGEELTTGTRRMVEEIASTRLVLRRALALAMEAEEKGETAEYIQRTEIYSNGCNRLMRLLRVGKAERGRLAAFLEKAMKDAIEEVGKEWV